MTKFLILTALESEDWSEHDIVDAMKRVFRDHTTLTRMIVRPNADLDLLWKLLDAPQDAENADAAIGG